MAGREQWSLQDQEAQVKRIHAIASTIVQLTGDPHLGIRSWWEQLSDAMKKMEAEMIAR
ncbi:hypothetical protein LCGC14_0768500 [marine sediment metagenome]|uniref:Uncharacterized protein n=1 Tax=marine sediment metagenome TaxID=412755 RepID=A0A0F9QIT8_9ZZZZ